MVAQEDLIVSRQDLANAVACFDNLTSLYLSDESVEMIDNAFLARLASSRPKLKALHVGRKITPTECGGNKDDHPVSEAGLEILFLKCTQLEEITLHCLHKDTELPESFFQLQHLRTVSLTNVSALTFSRFSKLSSLTSLDITVSRLTFQQLSGLARIPRLSILSISSEICLSKNDPSSATFPAAQLPYLKTLEFQVSSPNFTSLFPGGSPCSHLEQLVITKSTNLQRLPDDIGELLPSLRELTIRNCSQLDQLPNSITALTRLECLSITGSSLLQNLPKDFGQLPALKSLMLESVSLSGVPDSFCQVTTLEELSLVNCYKINQLPADFCSLTSLKTLNLKNLELWVLPERIGWLGNLETLHLHDCTQQRLFPSFAQLTSLRSLELGECAFTVLPDGLDNLSNLKHLNIHDCDVREIPDSITGLTSLVTFIIEGCQQLSLLPRSLSSLMELKFLKITWCGQLCGFPLSLPLSLEILVWYSNNRADSLSQISLPPCLQQLELGLEDNEFPLPLESLSQLHILCLCSAKMIQLPRSMGLAFQQIRELQLYKFEELRELPDTLSQLQHLILLEVVEAPKLTSIPDGIGALSRLIELDLSGCKALQQLPSTLTQLSCLSILTLEYTSISSLPPRFAQLTRLRTLKLSCCNQLRALPDDLTELKMLQHLDVKGCKQALDGISRALRYGLRDMHGLKFMKY